MPAATPLILFHDPVVFAQIDGTTWDGAAQGTLPMLHDYHGANPSSSMFGNASEIWDRQGKTVATGSFGSKSFIGTWSDDDVHFCQMLPYDYLGADGVAATLQVSTPGGTPRNVTQVGRIYEQVSTRVAACSTLGGRAVVVQSGGQGVGTAAYWVVDLAGGRVLWTHSFNLDALPVQVVSSRDGRYIAESQASAAGAQTGWTTTIYGPDGSFLNTVPGAAVAFSWDGSLVVLDAGGASGPARIVRAAGGSVVWSGPAGTGHGVWQAGPEPGGDGVAVAVLDPQATPSTDPGAAGYSPVDVYVVGADGKVVTELKAVYW